MATQLRIDLRVQYPTEHENNKIQGYYFAVNPDSANEIIDFAILCAKLNGAKCWLYKKTILIFSENISTLDNDEFPLTIADKKRIVDIIFNVYRTKEMNDRIEKMLQPYKSPSNEDKEN